MQKEKMKAVRIMPTGWTLLAIAAMLSLHFTIPLAWLIPHPWRLAGILLLLGGVVLVPERRSSPRNDRGRS
jgi:hypothetical protein